MKVAFDEHVPQELARTFEGLAKISKLRKASSGLIFCSARNYAPSMTKQSLVRKSDVPWLDKFAADGGRAIITGDVRMRQKPHELLTLTTHGFVVIFFEKSWGGWDFYKKTSLIVHWWEVICQKLKGAEKGTHWVVPSRWPVAPKDDFELRNVSVGLLQLLKDRPINKDTPRKSKTSRRPTKKNSNANLQSELKYE